MRFLSNLAAVLVKPRQTMRRILDSERRMVLPVVILAIASGVFGDFDAAKTRDLLEQFRTWQVALMVSGVIVLIIAVMVGLFYLYAYVPLFAGRFIGGKGNIRDTRAALAWGSAPAIWALLYRFPAAMWSITATGVPGVNVRNGDVRFDPGMIAQGCGVAAVFLFIELVVLVWSVVVMSNTVAEAHEYSALHGFGTLVISAIAPVIVVAAAVLAMM